MAKTRTRRWDCIMEFLQERVSMFGEFLETPRKWGRHKKEWKESA